MDNLTNIKYYFKNHLSFMDMCKITTLFDGNYDVQYYNFNSNIPVDYTERKFQVYLKNKDNDNSIQIEYNSIYFINMEPKDALMKFNEAMHILN